MEDTWGKQKSRAKTVPARLYSTLYDNTQRNLKQRWGILATENLLITIVIYQFLVNS